MGHFLIALSEAAEHLLVFEKSYRRVVLCINDSRLEICTGTIFNLPESLNIFILARISRRFDWLDPGGLVVGPPRGK